MNFEQEYLRVKEWMASYKVKVYKLSVDGMILIERGEDLPQKEGAEEAYKRTTFYTYNISQFGNRILKWEKVRLSSDKLHGQLRKMLTKTEFINSNYGVPKQVKVSKLEQKYCLLLNEMRDYYDFNEIEWLKPIIENDFE